MFAYISTCGASYIHGDLAMQGCSMQTQAGERKISPVTQKQQKNTTQKPSSNSYAQASSCYGSIESCFFQLSGRYEPSVFPFTQLSLTCWHLLQIFLYSLRLEPGTTKHDPINLPSPHKPISQSALGCASGQLVLAEATGELAFACVVQSIMLSVQLM